MVLNAEQAPGEESGGPVAGWGPPAAPARDAPGTVKAAPRRPRDSGEEGVASPRAGGTSPPQSPALNSVFRDGSTPTHLPSTRRCGCPGPLPGPLHWGLPTREGGRQRKREEPDRPPSADVGVPRTPDPGTRVPLLRAQSDHGHVLPGRPSGRCLCSAHLQEKAAAAVPLPPAPESDVA
ncbi:hypothetical protein J1605_015682 [Eschrichtius robustus]|uniref:Uncharacterized protein n=1 Tax=Eschrichtius robustus TaxID=9764 RepID=A0AB34G9F2_ESCRO|nr:hypothetical protein J1605_015682 [Eschrichtius robustus]